ncbi:hypothetical protein [Paraburkholderia humisilvae]|uniref:hypothetical protein n=1 Tax=Paraburkholderia humisilvae TaxID=627669 RepID=UPI0035E8FBAD
MQEADGVTGTDLPVTAGVAVPVLIMSAGENIPDARIEALGWLARNGPGRSAVSSAAGDAADPELEKSIRESVDWHGAPFPDAGG